MRRLLLLLPLLSLAFAAAPARASEGALVSMMMDDNQLLYSGGAARDFALRRMKALGVDYVRVTVLWRNVADRMRKAARRHPENPRAYRKTNWDPYDGVVRAGKRYGVGIFFNVTGPGPAWEMGTPPKSQRKYADTWDPDAKHFGRFVQAVGRRYDGTYRDENEGRKALPVVRFWSLFNEPNQAGWLTPQFKGSTPWSPVMYRNLWYYGRRGLDHSGHHDDVVLIGETAPLGNTNGNPGSPMYPKQFISEFFCAHSNGSPLGGASARRRHCDTLKRIEPLRYTAWAHHPYTKKLAPDRRDPNPNSITIANIGELPSFLDAMKAPRDGLAASNLVALTEFGYETNPPDPFSGISAARQAEYINEGDYLAFKQPRVIANTQFLLRDVPGIRRYRKGDKRHWFNYQSGLFYDNGKPKPSATAYTMPLVITAHSGSSTSFWGWLRFLPPGATTQVYLQFRPSGSGTWENVGDPVPVTNKVGFFEASVPRGGAGTWRALFLPPYGGAVITSREIKTS
jgi:hypothetical protein